jgi:hypothetical protein
MIQEKEEEEADIKRMLLNKKFPDPCLYSIIFPNPTHRQTIRRKHNPCKRARQKKQTHTKALTSHNPIFYRRDHYRRTRFCSMRWAGAET